MATVQMEGLGQLKKSSDLTGNQTRSLTAVAQCLNQLRYCVPQLLPWVTICLNLCGGGDEYLHRDPASRKKQRNGTKTGRAIA
jgi:hypothetical protein